MDITRINAYTDKRFSQTVLNQHGAYIVDDEPYEIEIISNNTAVVRGKNRSAYEELIEEFRYHAPHVCRFLDGTGTAIKEYPAAEETWIEVSNIQPSQFYVDEDKLEAIKSFINKEEDIVVQVIPWNDWFISLDGHTRLYRAYLLGFRQVKAVIVEQEEWGWQFVSEAQKRGIISPKDMTLLSHDDYEVEWNQFCDSIFADEKGPGHIEITEATL